MKVKRRKLTLRQCYEVLAYAWFKDAQEYERAGHDPLFQMDQGFSLLKYSERL